MWIYNSIKLLIQAILAVPKIIASLSKKFFFWLQKEILTLLIAIGFILLLAIILFFWLTAILFFNVLGFLGLFTTTALLIQDIYQQDFIEGWLPFVFAFIICGFSTLIAWLMNSSLVDFIKKTILPFIKDFFLDPDKKGREVSDWIDQQLEILSKHVDSILTNSSTK